MEPKHITCPAIQAALAEHTLPHLKLHDLARLACTCTILRDLVYQQGTTWRTAAMQHLPAGLHFQLQGQGRAGVQQLMQRRAAAVENVIGGRTAGSVEVKLHITQVRLPMGRSRLAFLPIQLTFSHDDRLLACSSQQHMCVVDSESGQEIWIRSDCELFDECSLTPCESRRMLDMCWAASSEYLVSWYGSCSPAQSLRSDNKAYLLSIHARTGRAVLLYALEPEVLTSQDGPLLSTRHSQRRFAPNGQLLAVTTSESERGMSRTKQASISVLDTSKGNVLMSIPFPPGAYNYSAGLCWSQDSKVIFSGGLLLNIDGDSIKRLSAGADHYWGICFDTKGDLLGYTVVGSAHDQEHLPQLTAVVVHTNTGEILLSVPNSKFIGFVGQHALVKPKDQQDLRMKLQLWGLSEGQCVQDFNWGGDQLESVNPVMLLGDRALAAKTEPWDSPRLCLGAVDQAKVLDLGVCTIWQPSHDNCKLAMLQRPLNDCQRIRIIFLA